MFLDSQTRAMFSFLDTSADYSFKLVLVGPAMSGKSAIYEQLRDNDFPITYEPTTKSDSFTKRIQVKSMTTKVEVWDTPGQEKYRSEVASKIEGCDALIFVYDPTSTSSIAEVKELIGQYGSQSTTKNVLKVVVANKSDLVTKVMENPFQGVQYRSFNLQHYSLCSKKSEAVENLFEDIVKKMVNYQEEGLIKRRSPSKRPDEIVTHLENGHRIEGSPQNTVIILKVEAKNTNGCSERASCKSCAIF